MSSRHLWRVGLMGGLQRLDCGMHQWRNHRRERCSDGMPATRCILRVDKESKSED